MQNIREPFKLSRAVNYYTDSAPRIVSALIFTVFFVGWLYSQSYAIFSSWNLIFEGIGNVFRIPLFVALSNQQALDVTVLVKIDAIEFEDSLIRVLLLALSLILFSNCFKKDNAPVKYSLTAISVLLIIPCVLPVLTGNYPRFDINATLAQVFFIGYWFLLLSPLMFWLVGFTLPGNLAKKVVLTAFFIGYFFVSIPILASLSLGLLALFGPAILPFTNGVLTLLLLCIQFMAFYGILASID